MDDWIKTAQFSVGGFLWTGFSKNRTNKLICISSEYISVIDCDTGKVEVCDGDYDEDGYIAIYDINADKYVKKKIDVMTGPISNEEYEAQEESDGYFNRFKDSVIYKVAGTVA